MHDLIVFVDFF